MTSKAGESGSDSFNSNSSSSSLGANITLLFFDAELVGRDFSILLWGVFISDGVLRFEGVFKTDGVLVMSSRA